MKRIVYLVLLCSLSLWAAAQKKAPKWMDKQSKAVVTVIAYNKDNQQIATGNGFFVSETGEALSAYSLFKDATRAVVKDAEGHEWTVERILGADELYDVIRFQVAVEKKVSFLPLAREPLANGAAAYLLPFTTGKRVDRFGMGTVTEVSKLKGSYSYYKTSIALAPSDENAPVLTEAGEVFGLAQADASGKTSDSYAVSAGYAHSLAITSADAFNTTYTRIGIRKAWPATADQAQVALYLYGNGQDAKEYLATLNDFVATFPQSPDGYLARANHYAYHYTELATTPAGQQEMLDKALADVDEAARLSGKPSDALYNRAKLIYGVVLTDTTRQEGTWSIATALKDVNEAIATDDQPAYHQLRADIQFNQGNYGEAYDDYMVVNRSGQALPSSWYWAAKAKMNLPNVNFGEVIALLDSAISKSGTPPLPEAAPYILDRIELKLKLMNFIGAVQDYNLYYEAMQGRVNDSFYYYREQARFRLGDLDGALADIQQALQLAPDNADYLAEEASVYLRQQKYDEALGSVEKALAITPDFAACYRLRSVCYLRQKRKAEACEALHKARELGDPVAERLIKENCQ